MTKILEFPYDRIRVEAELHEAKILQLPAKSVDPLLLPMAFALVWMSLFRV